MHLIEKKGERTSQNLKVQTLRNTLYDICTHLHNEEL